ncbi:MAG: hypothetical protein HY699_15460 [Deltaproteobacteria bacterium]|nr:hypothetical protein [Deltaproteobacteria bacterium]
MANLPHLFPPGTAAAKQYTYAREVKGRPLKVPTRDRVPHGTKLIHGLRDAEQQRTALHPHRQLDAVADDEGSHRLLQESVEDSMMVRHYGFTDEEFDLFANYVIRYRLDGEAD